ncbi:PTS sugar transporter subunit IIB [Collinsella sp. zg1085]|uniref:PTS sugar transporter subunit IIB n=1 Tax=Collinsella sp. zg1085 TaxID=2844380 RepID=UPI001C0BC570|nr:PTS sugar transporter subunit IIB [Collinsella sp. zg1085]QWT17296.1 PTS sugar transporter subunit IIB [Collinsella sp. zg1085]
MAQIEMARVDYRLVHGQIIAKWIKFYPVDRLILVDEALLNDDFMADIYRAAAGDAAVDITDVKGIQAALDAHNDKIMLIFKDVASAVGAYEAGVPLTELNVGAVPGAPHRKTVIQGIALSREEYNQLDVLRANGVNVFLQPIPEASASSLASIKSKLT